MTGAAKTDQQARAAAMVAAACVYHARRRGLLGSDQELHHAHPALAAFGDHRYNPGLSTAVPTLPEKVTRQVDYSPSTYYLANLYQQESVEAVKQRAFCQTPQFVTRLMLDCTWENAVDELDRAPYPETPETLPLRSIDPACGGGHILVELFDAALVASNMRDREAVVRDALSVVHGVDLDPFAVAIARYRLLVSACEWLRCRFDECPRDLPVQVAAGNSLLYKPTTVPHEGMLFDVFAGAPVVADTPAGGPHSDLDEFPGILDHGRYDVVVANPPYITPKDAETRDAIRDAYPEVCSGNYALSVPFEVLFHRLARPGGWVARLTANSFMKREFGKKVIEEYFTTLDFQWIIDTSGAYIPGHGTPTTILISRARPPTGDTVRTVMGIRGEPSMPPRPELGHVWTAIADAVYPYERDRRAAAAMRRVDRDLEAAEALGDAA